MPRWWRCQRCLVFCSAYYYIAGRDEREENKKREGCGAGGWGEDKRKKKDRREKKEQENIIHKQELEKKLIDKAIKVKKKQLKKIEIFDDLSDEDTTPQTIQKPKQEKPKVIQAPKPVIINPYNEFKKKFNIN